MDGVGASPPPGSEPPTASPPIRPDPGGDEPRTRGFLFCDLRDYTAFVEANGDRAAADLLERYRALVRSAVARTAGAEIRTEGDGFYVVFPSASPAVRCGLDVVAAAADASAAAPATPIRVGVGIHAGESVEGAEGFVGSAVNIAARVCAEAEPGEVLVTDTVRGLVRTSLDVRFIPRGHPRLKGISEPIALYRVTGERSLPAMRVARTATRSLVAALVVVGIAVILAGAAIATRPWAPRDPDRRPPAATGPSGVASSAARSSAPVSGGESPAGSAEAALPGRLAFIASQVVGADMSPRGQLYVAEAGGGAWKRMTELTAQVVDAAWSPDGRRLVYSSKGDANLPPRIVEVATAPTTVPWPWPWGTTDTVRWQGVDYALASFSWSAGGELIVGAYASEPAFKARVFAAAADGSSGRLVTEPDPAIQSGAADDYLPAVSPDGLTVAFASGPSRDRLSIWASAADGSRRIQVTSDVGVLLDPMTVKGLSWSPDGSRLVFAGQAQRDGPVEIWTVDAQGTNLRRLTDDAATDRGPAWSPDGRWIAWTRTVSGQRQIWVMAADGTSLRPLIVGGQGEQLDLLGWAPDPG